MWKLKYAATATRLLLQRKIPFRTYCRALRNWPPAVPGRGGSYILDPNLAAVYFSRGPNDRDQSSD